MSGIDLTVGPLDWSTAPLRVGEGSDLTATADLRRAQEPVPRRRGEPLEDGWEAPRRDDLDVQIFGHVDMAGDPSLVSEFDQVLANVRAVRQAIRHSHAAPLVAQFTVDSVTYEADVIATLRGQVEGAVLWRGTLGLDVPAGYWRKATADTFTSASSASTRTFTVTNDGSLDLYDAVIELSGAATAVTLTNQSFGDGPSVTFTGSLGTLTTLTCGTKDADRDGSPVHGLVDHDGHDGWLPLLAGDNTIEVAPTGGAVAVEVAVQPAW